MAFKGLIATGWIGGFQFRKDWHRERLSDNLERASHPEMKAAVG